MQRRFIQLLILTGGIVCGLMVAPHSARAQQNPPKNPPAEQELIIAPTKTEEVKVAEEDDPEKLLVTPTTPAAAAPTISAEARAAKIAALRHLLIEANAQADQYNKLFRDLMAREVRTSELINRDGTTKKKRIVTSDFFVYQSRLDDKMAYEYRHAKTVDGKPAKEDAEKLSRIFERLANAATLRHELSLINSEAFRHDLDLPLQFYGTTLYQWREIRDYALPFVAFDLGGRVNVNGDESIILHFSQLRPNVRLEWDLPGLNKTFASATQLTRGSLWLDAGTKQFRRAQREMWLTPKDAAQPVRIWRQTMEYAPSEYGILIPRKFTFEFFTWFKRGKGGIIESELSGQMICEYGDFKRFSVTGEDDQKKTIIREKPAETAKPPDKP
jgi:hypothetical protein